MSLNHEQSDKEDIDDSATRPLKRRRNFIARNACQACRTRKSRCDEDSPCSLCKSLNIECVYAEPRGFKHETSLSIIMGAIKRVETKIDRVSANVFTSPATPSHLSDHHAEPTQGQQLLQSNRNVGQEKVGSLRRQDLSYSARHTLTWTLDTKTLNDQDRMIHLEAQQHPLPTDSMQGSGATEWLSSLSLSLVQQLSNAYFDTFNRIYPVLDPDCYFAEHLSNVVQHGFGCSIDATLVLCVMALGCMGQKAYDEGGYPREHDTAQPVNHDFGPEGMAGLYLINEARKRMGFFLCERSLQSCQCYLLLAAYYAQLMRPLDEWVMTHQACEISAAYWMSPSRYGDEYHVDMQRRVFWSALLRETILVDELELPRCTLHELEINGIVALPTFRQYKQGHVSRLQDAYYHYHFLAQIAIRLIMTRTRAELFNTNPSYALIDELRHQFEQWRSNIPRSIQSDFDSDSEQHTEPAQTYVVAMLQGRHHIARYHFGRPFLFKAVTSPSALQGRDVEICTEAIEAAVEWFAALRRCITMHSYNQVQYFICGQLFGQLLIVHRLRTAEDPVVREIVPVGIDQWWADAVSFLQEMAPSNPTIARDASLLLSLTASPEKTS